VALGETGLDRYWTYSPFDVQQDFFDRHLRLSQERGLPFIVHTRDCDADALAMLREARQRGPLAGVMHSFTGSVETAAECVALGLYVSFAGMVTFKKSAELRGVAKGIPDDRILIETDSPYLSPHPLRGRRNEPAHLVHTAACLAQERGVSIEAFGAQTSENARRLLRFAEA
jgi:TatD DNase family protein